MSRVVYAIALTGVIVHVAAIGHGFASFDDPQYVVENARIQRTTLAGLASLWDPRGPLHGAFWEWFPLRDTLSWTLYGLFGARAAPFHVVQIALHATCVVLVAQVLRRLLPTERAALWGALLFAVHPIHTESVAWIASIKDPLHALFMLVALDRFLAYRAHGGRRLLVVAFAACVLGLLSKAPTVALPGLLVIVDQLRIDRPPLARSIKDTSPFFLVTIPFAALFIAVGRANDVLHAPLGGTFASSVYTSIASLLFYASKLTVPVDLCARYLFPPVVTLADPRLVASLSLYGAATVFAIARRRHEPRWGLLLAFFTVSMTPMLSLLPHHVEVADRFAYVPSIAFCAAFGLVVDRAASVNARVSGAVSGAVVVVAAVLALVQTSTWSTDERVWRRIAAQEGALARHSFVGNMLGMAVASEGRGDEAEDLWRRAAAIDDPFAWLPLVNLSVARLARGDVADAARLADEATVRFPHAAPGFTARGDAAAAAGDRVLAAAAYARALKLQPMASTSWNRMLVLLGDGRPEEAIVEAKRATTLDPALCARLSRFVAARADAAPLAASRCEGAQ